MAEKIQWSKMEPIACPTCGQQFKRTKKNKKYCSGQCYHNNDEVKARARQMVARCREKYPQGKPAPYVGVCQQCGQEFRAKQKGRKYCSMKCYTSSPEVLERLRANSQILALDARRAHGLDSAERLTKKCVECESEFYVKPKDFTARKFCSQLCYRLYMAGRFDRWVANPESIALPQCYDEFLTQEELPCLVEGCGWLGKNLGFHVNRAHGIKAEEFKELAGFNRSTGLVAPSLSRKLSAFHKDLMAAMIANGFRPHVPTGQMTNSPGMIRLEGREHAFKAQAIIKAGYQQKPDEYTCVVCRQPALRVRPGGKKLYCSIECQRKYYNSRRWEMTCCQCVIKFLGDQYQWRRVRRGLDVCCSFKCRGARNIVLTPNHQKRIAKSSI